MTASWTNHYKFGDKVQIKKSTGWVGGTVRFVDERAVVVIRHNYPVEVHNSRMIRKAPK